MYKWRDNTKINLKEQLQECRLINWQNTYMQQAQENELQSTENGEVWEMVCSFFYNIFPATKTIYSIKQLGDKWMMDCKRFGRKRWWPNFKVLVLSLHSPPCSLLNNIVSSADYII
jgi:hypothetical protein